MEKRYDSEIFQILHYLNNYLDNKSKLELRKAKVWVSLLQKSVAELELFSEFYVPDIYRSILWRILQHSHISLTKVQMSLIEGIPKTRKVSTYDEYVTLADMLFELYTAFLKNKR